MQAKPINFVHSIGIDNDMWHFNIGLLTCLRHMTRLETDLTDVRSDPFGVTKGYWKSPHGKPAVSVCANDEVSINDF